MEPSDYDSAASHVGGNTTKGQASKDPRARRRMKLSQKAFANYEAERDNYIWKLDNIWERIANDLQEIQATKAETRQAVTGRIQEEYARYQALSGRYVAFLLKVNAKQSQLDLDLQKTTNRDRDRAVRVALMDPNISPERVTTPRNSKRSSSEHSVKSAVSLISTTTSIAAARARADAAAARTRASFTKKEIAMKLERTKLDAELEVLQLEKEAAAAEAQADILEAAAEQHGGEHHVNRTITEASENRAQRTLDYVLDQASAHNAPCPRLPERVAAPELSEVTKYLVRRDLVSTGLTKFDDRPENYRVWRATFKGMVRMLEVTANEELDLLVKWLGAESSSYARRLRSVHVDSPSAGLKIVWERLEECYGRPEVIEDALFERIGRFPKLSDKDAHRLRDLGDLLLELEAAKADPHLTGLSYLDTARGVNPIVEKLPHRLQEMWISKGSKYKEDHHVAFPPFLFFSRFVRDQARTRNDPSFAFATAGNAFLRFPKNDKPAAREGFNRTPVSVQATDVTPEAVENSPSTRSKEIEDPNKRCPLHKKPNPLRKCRGFREKQLEERKALLKEFGICFRCCSSVHHLARDCQVTIKCFDCGSDRHTTALHPSSSKPSSFTPEGCTEYSKVNHEPSPDVSSNCTEVCGGDYSGKSCSQICLVSVSHRNEPRKTVRMYAVLDDQSNRSLARTEFFDLFDVQGDSSPYTLRTCAGTAETTGRRAAGFLVGNVDGSVQLPLPTLIECNQMLNNRNEIPTPEAARHHPHLEALASLIPPLDPDAQILLLLGRDILRVHKVRQHCNGPPDAPFAQRLDLGWVIIGDVCIGHTRKPDCVTNLKTNVLENGRPSVFESCRNNFFVEKFTGLGQVTQHTPPVQNTVVKSKYDDEVTDTLLQTTKDDNQPAPSVEDRRFLNIMNSEDFKDESCSWVAPLPFREPRCRLSNNKELAQSHLSSLRRTLQKKPEMREHFVTFMDKARIVQFEWNGCNLYRCIPDGKTGGGGGGILLPGEPPFGRPRDFNWPPPRKPRSQSRRCHQVGPPHAAPTAPPPWSTPGLPERKLYGAAPFRPRKNPKKTRKDTKAPASHLPPCMAGAASDKPTASGSPTQSRSPASTTSNKLGTPSTSAIFHSTPKNAALPFSARPCRTPDDRPPSAQHKRETAQPKMKSPALTIRRSQEIPESDKLGAKLKRPLRTTTTSKPERPSSSTHSSASIANKAFSRPPPFRNSPRVYSSTVFKDFNVTGRHGHAEKVSWDKGHQVMETPQYNPPPKEQRRQKKRVRYKAEVVGSNIIVTSQEASPDKKQEGAFDCSRAFAIGPQGSKAKEREPANGISAVKNPPVPTPGEKTAALNDTFKADIKKGRKATNLNPKKSRCIHPAVGCLCH